MKERIGIEKLLAWAYRDELPKAGAARALSGVGYRRAHRAVEEFALYLTLIDCDGENRFGLAPDLTAMEEPHPDAIRVYDAVRELEGVAFEAAAEWDPLSDLGLIGDAAPGLLAKALVRIAAGDAPLLVRRQAILGGAPHWEAEAPKVVITKGANGKKRWFRKIIVETENGPIESEVEGFDKASQRPMQGAYFKSHLEPDPTDAVLGRADYAVWRAALDLLAEALRGSLERWDVQPSERPALPWAEDGGREARILPALYSRKGGLTCGWNLT